MPKKSTKKNTSSVVVVASGSNPDQQKDDDQIDSRLFVDNVNLLDLHDENHGDNNNNLLASTVSERSDSVSSSVHNIRARERQRQHEKELEATENNLQQRSSSSTATKKRSSSKKKQSKRGEQVGSEEDDQQQRQKSGTFSNALEADLLGPLYDDSKPPEGFASPSSAEFMRQEHLQQQRLRNNAKENDPDALLQELLTRQSSGTSNMHHGTSTGTPSQEGDEAHSGGLKKKTSSSSGSSYNYNQQNNLESQNIITSSGTGGLLALSSPPKHHLEQSRKQQQKQQQLQRASSSSSSASPQTENNKANTKIVTTRSGKTKKIIIKPRAPLSAAEIARRRKERQRELEQVYTPLAHVIPPPKESLGSLFPTKFILLLTVGILAGLTYSIIAIIFGAATFEDHVDEAICKAKSPSAGVRPVPYRVMVLASVTSVLVPVIINLVKYHKTSIESLASIDQSNNNNNSNSRTRTPTKNRKEELERNLLGKNNNKSAPRSPSAEKQKKPKEKKNKKTKIVTLTKIITRPVPKEERSPTSRNDEEAEDSAAEDEEEFYEEEEEYEEEVECFSVASSSSSSALSSPANSLKSPKHQQSDDDDDDEQDGDTGDESDDEEDDVHHLADDEFSDSKSNQDKNSNGDLYRSSSREIHGDREDNDDEDGEDESFSWNERLPFVDSINRKGYKELAWIFQIYASVDARWYLVVVLYTVANFAYNIFAIQDERETTFEFSNVWDRYQSFYLRWFQSGTVAVLGIYFTQLLTTMVCFEIAGTPNEIGEKDFLKEKLQMLKESRLEAADASLMRMMNPTNGGSSSPLNQPSALKNRNNNSNNRSSSLASLGAGAEEMRTQQQFASTNNNQHTNNNSEDFPSLFLQDEATKVRDMKSLTRIIGNISLPLATLLVSKSEEITDTLTFVHVFLGGLLLYPGFITHVLPSAVIFLPLTVLFALAPAICYFAIRNDLRPFASLLDRDNGKEGLCRRHRISVICAILICRIVGTFVIVALCQTMMCYSAMFFSSSKGPYGATISNEVNYRDMDCYLWAMNKGAHDVYHKLQMIGLIFS